MKKIVEKFCNQKTSYLMVEGVIFLTMYTTVGNGMVTAVGEQNIMYFLVGLIGWSVQFGLVLIMCTLFYLIVFYLKKVLFWICKKVKTKK